jgi:4-amino-4-deoxy-L-arabinose transferase-like glycosyltransferase
MIPAPLSGRQFRFWLILILLTAAVLRTLFPAADPPWQTTVGIVWHDEGAWVHNARNRALFGAWSLDQWNPMFIAPVFTGLEYVSFALFGTGVRQARLVPEALGCISVLLLGLGIARIAGQRAGLIAAALAATNYVYVMWNRAALMEGPMTAFMVASWFCYAQTKTSARWGWGAALFACLAYFTKAAAAFFVLAIGLDALATLALYGRSDARARAAARTTIVALFACGVIALAMFVGPHWKDYWFYNVQMSVTRKPSYDLASVLDRLTWFPVLHDLFTRMWLTLTLGAAAAIGVVVRWRQAAPGERVLVLWVALGALELVAHDVGNERRFIFFIPPLAGLASILLGRDRSLLPSRLAEIARRKALLALPFVAYVLYVLFASAVRLGFLYEIRPNVRIAAVLALVVTAAVYATWPRFPRALSSTWSPAASALLAVILCVGQVGQYVQWAAGRTYENYEASVELGRVLPPGTLVHGKLANGLSLENRIKPIFVGRGFGNYADRKTRDDVRYILTYIAPSVGYESQRKNPVIQDVLDAYPNRKIIMTFDVAETATGHDRAALIDKFGTAGSTHGQTTGRAQN